MSEVVVDTSAAVAVLTGEPVGGQVVAALEGADRRLMSAASMAELGIVMEVRFGPVGIAVVSRFLRAAEIEVVPFDSDQAETAVDAWRRFGRGNHPAGLNLGDCFTYALAATTGTPVVAVGADFPATDLAVLPTR